MVVTRSSDTLLTTYNPEDHNPSNEKAVGRTDPSNEKAVGRTDVA
jgi:hypothetical protein